MGDMKGSKMPGGRAGPGRGRSGRGGRGQGSAEAGRTQAQIRLSKKLSRMLRHHPPPSIDGSGWVPLADVMSSLQSGSVTVSDIQAVVNTDEKGRFQLDLDGQPPRIRATQGHSVQLAAPVLQPIRDAAQAPTAIHVTSKDAWAVIQQDGCLRRMSRTHIHFATKETLGRKNKWANCFLKLKVKQALDDGVALHLSTNGVVLCEGPLPVKYVEEVTDPADVWGD